MLKRRLIGPPAGVTITARLRDGDEVLTDVVTVTAVLDGDGDRVAVEASFAVPSQLPVLLEFMQDGVPLPGTLLISRGDDSTAETGEFASLADLAVVLGRFDETAFTSTEAARGALLLSLASGLITDAVGRDSAWAIALDPIPVVLRAVCLEMVKRVMNNMSGARSESEALGQYQHSVSWTDNAHGLLLTDAEAKLCRRVILGQPSGSARMDSLITELACAAPITRWIGDSPS